MADHHTSHPAPIPMWLRLSRWLGTAGRAGGSTRSSGLDSTRLDLGYEAAYAPTLTERIGGGARFEDDHPGH
jgi:hypothetical protein